MADITWAHVVDHAAELSVVDTDAQTDILAHANIAINLSNVGLLEASPTLKLMRVYLAAHYGTHAVPGSGGGTSGPVTSEREGDLARTYASSIMTGAWDDFQTTSYGRAFLAMIRARLAGPTVL